MTHHQQFLLFPANSALMEGLRVQRKSARLNQVRNCPFQINFTKKKTVTSLSLMVSVSLWVLHNLSSLSFIMLCNKFGLYLNSKWTISDVCSTYVMFTYCFVKVNHSVQIIWAYTLNWGPKRDLKVHYVTFKLHALWTLFRLSHVFHHAVQMNNVSYCS